MAAAARLAARAARAEHKAVQRQIQQQEEEQRQREREAASLSSPSSPPNDGEWAPETPTPTPSSSMSRRDRSLFEAVDSTKGQGSGREVQVVDASSPAASTTSTTSSNSGTLVEGLTRAFHGVSPHLVEDLCALAGGKCGLGMFSHMDVPLAAFSCLDSPPKPNLFHVRILGCIASCPLSGDPLIHPSDPPSSLSHAQWERLYLRWGDWLRKCGPSSECGISSVPPQGGNGKGQTYEQVWEATSDPETGRLVWIGG